MLNRSLLVGALCVALGPATAVASEPSTPPASDSSAPAVASPAASSTPSAAAPSTTTTPAPAEAAPASPASAASPAPQAADPKDAVSPDKREATLAAVEKVTVAILSLDGNKAAQDDAPGVASILASTLAESAKFKVITQADIAAVLGVERQRSLLSGGDCSTDACMTELAGALGSRYLVAGRLDRYGERYILTTTVFDSRSANSLAKPRAEVGAQEKLPDAATSIGNQIRAALGDDPAKVKTGPFSISLKVGSGFIASLTNFAPSGDLELGYRFADEWVLLAQIGFKPVRSEADGVPSQVNLLPSFVGVRKLHFIESKFQPYWGLGLGIQLALGRFGIFEETGPLPSLWALGGFQYMFTPHIGAMLEGKTNVAQAVLGFVGTTQNTNGFNIDLSAGVHFRF